MSEVKLYQGDCLEILPTLAAGSVDLTVTSPPYDNLRDYHGYTFDVDRVSAELWRVTKDGGVVVWVVSDATIDGSETLTSFKHALSFKEFGFNVETMIYKVMGTGAKGSNYYYWQAFEYMFVFSKGQPTAHNLIRDKKNLRKGVVCSTGEKSRQTGTRQYPIGGKIIQELGTRENVWEYHAGNNGDDQTEHPAPFPESLAQDHILTWSNPGDTVLDPMMGSGTTGKMAVKNGRNFLGCEISPAYLAIASRRIEQAQAQLALPLFGAVS